MSCPTCGYDMVDLKSVIANFWCGRCGTIILNNEVHSCPKLVERCREFGPTLYSRSVHAWNDWVKLGIAEAINKPEDRK